MAYFQRVEPDALALDIFHKIGKEWFLLSVTDPDGTRNPMTASWGGLGYLWGEPVFFLFVRANRYTHTLLSGESGVTISFFSEKHRQVLRFCGSHSGRECDKEKEGALHPFRMARGYGYEEAELVIAGTPLYGAKLSEEGIFFPKERSFYEKEPMHTLFVCKVEEILRRVEKN